MDRITIYKSESAEFKVSMDLYFNEEGEFVFDGGDIGSGVKRIWGRSQYEYGFTISSTEVNKLFEVMQVEVSDRKTLFLKLKDRFGNNEGYSEFCNFLADKEISYQSYTWS
jgi:hypothetical protein